MCRSSLHMVTHHWNSILCLRSYEDNVKNLHRCAEISVRRIIRKPIVEDLLENIYVIFADESVQLRAEENKVYKYILRQVRGSTSFMGGI